MSSPSTAPSSKKKKGKKIKKTKSSTDTSKASPLPQTPPTPLPNSPQSPQSAPALQVPPEKTESKKKKATKRKGKKATSAGSAKEKPKETEKPSEQEKKPKKETEKPNEQKPKKGETSDQPKKLEESEKPKETKTKSIKEDGPVLKDTNGKTDQVSSKETKPKSVKEEQPIVKQPPKEGKPYQPLDTPITKSPKPAEKKIPVDLDEEKDDHEGHVEDDSDYSLYRDLGAGATAIYSDLKNFKKPLDDEDYDELDGYGGGSTKKAVVEVPIFQKILKQVKFPSFDAKPGVTWVGDLNAQEFSDIHRWQQRDIQLYYLQQTFVPQGQSIYTSLSSLLETKLPDLDLSKKTQLRVATIGGGPLTDAVALCAYLKQQLSQVQSFDIINFDFVGDIWEKTIKEAKFITAVQSEIKELKHCEFVRFNIDGSDPQEIAVFGKDNPIDVFIVSELIFHTRNIFNQEFWSKLFKELSNSVFIFAEKRYLMGVFDPIEKITTIAEKTKRFTVIKHSDGMSLIGIPKKDKGEDEEDLGEEIDEAAD